MLTFKNRINVISKFSQTFGGCYAVDIAVRSSACIIIISRNFILRHFNFTFELNIFSDTVFKFALLPVSQLMDSAIARTHPQYLLLILVQLHLGHH